MKRLIISFILLLSFTTGFSQNLNFGIKAGASISSFSNSDKQFVGVLGGLCLEYKFNKIWSFESEFLYTQRGSETSYEVLNWDDGNEPPTFYDLDITEKNDLHYLNLGLYVKYFFNKRINFGTGMILGNVINASRDVTVVDMDTGEEEANLQSSAKEISNTDFRIPLSIEYRFKSGLSFEAQYSFGFLSLYDSGDSVNSQAFDLTVGYYF